MGILIVKCPCLSCHRCWIVKVERRSKVVVIASPLPQKEVLASEANLLLSLRIAVGEPGSCFANAITGMNLTKRVLVATFAYVPEV